MNDPNSGVKRRRPRALAALMAAVLVLSMSLAAPALAEGDITSTSLRTVVEKYIRLGLITATDDVDAVMEKVWTPVLDE